MTNDFLNWVMENKIKVADSYVQRWILDLYDDTTTLYSMCHLRIEFIQLEDKIHLELICTPNLNIG